jgi:hypothetical protein
MPNINILDLLNRPRLREKQEKAAKSDSKRQGNFLVRNAKWLLFGFANVVAIFFDWLAISGAWWATHNYVLTALMVLPTGVPLILWEIGWLYPLGDKEQQKKRSVIGILLSIVTAFLIGGSSILILLGITGWPEYVMFGVAMLAVIVHGVQAGLYFYHDPIIKRDHELQVFASEHGYQADTMTHLQQALATLEPLLDAELKLRQKYGDAVVDKGLERLMGIQATVDTGREPKGGSKPVNVPNPANVPSPVYVAEAESVAYRENGGSGTDPSQRR